MNLLVIYGYFPMPDRASGDLRLYSMLKILAKQHDITFLCYGAKHQITEYGQQESDRYQANLNDLGIRTHIGKSDTLLKNNRFEIVLLEFYTSAELYLDRVRYFQPWAKVLVDSVDVHFKRLESKARLSGNPRHIDDAKRMKKAELSIYRRCDAIIVVTDDDKTALDECGITLPTMKVPNIHDIPPLASKADRNPTQLIFIGAFHHPPNVDAIIYFCKQIFPKLLKDYQHPQAIELLVIGNSPPTEITDLESEHIKVLGYVPSTAPYLASSYLSIAPLRFGAGMKGKIGEAMANGLPVITTSVGAEGFGVTDGIDLLIGDNPDDFKNHILQLLNDPELHDKIGTAGRAFIEQHYSTAATQRALDELLEQTRHLQPKRLSLIRRCGQYSRLIHDDRLLWRINKVKRLASRI